MPKRNIFTDLKDELKKIKVKPFGDSQDGGSAKKEPIPVPKPVKPKEYDK